MKAGRSLKFYFADTISFLTFNLSSLPSPSSPLSYRGNKGTINTLVLGFINKSPAPRY